LSRRSEPLDLASQHGAELFGNQLKQQLAGFKQQLYQVRPD
jgi:hypothetical protein